MSVIEVRNLIKRFPLPSGRGDLLAVNDVTFSVGQGEIFGLLGPNGAGKTTTLEIIEGLQEPTSGETFVKGINTHKELAKAKELMGIQLQSSSYYEYLQLQEILALFGSFYKRALEPMKLLELVELTEKRKALIKHLSGGQQQRFSLCAALVNDPEIVFLDEPTTGLDPQARRHLWEVIRNISAKGKTIILTTHYMEEAEYLCGRVGIMDEGKIKALDTPKSLIRQLKSSAHIQFTAENHPDLESLKALSGVLDVKHDGAVFRLDVTVGNAVLPSLYKWADQHNVFMQDLEVISANLENVFLSLTGKHLRE